MTQDVSDFAQSFNQIFAATFVPTLIYMTLRQFFQAIQVVKPALYVSCFAVAVNIGMNQLLIHGAASWAGLGFIGSPLATFVSILFCLGAFFAYAIHVRGYHRVYWGGWSSSSFGCVRVARFLRVAGPIAVSGAMQCWGSQVIQFGSSRLKTNEVACMEVLSQIGRFLWTGYNGWGLAA